MKEGTRQGRHKKRWEDNFREWTGQEFAKSQRAVEKREKWRKLVAKLSVVSQTTLAVKGWMMKMMNILVREIKLRATLTPYVAG